MFGTGHRIADRFTHRPHEARDFQPGSAPIDINLKVDRTKQRLDLYGAYLTRLGAPSSLLEHVKVHFQDFRRMARPLERVEPLEPGTVLNFKRF